MPKATEVAAAFKAGRAAGKAQRVKGARQRKSAKAKVGRLRGPKMGNRNRKKGKKRMGGVQGAVREKVRRFTAPAARGFEGRGGGRTRGTYVSNNSPINIPIVGNATTAAGVQMVWMYNLNPGLPPDGALAPGVQSLISGLSTRLAQEAILYENHDLSRRGCHITVNYKSACASTDTGEVIISYFKNPKLSLPSGGTARQQYLEQQHVYGSIWKDHRFTPKITREDRKIKRVRGGVPSLPNNDGGAATGQGFDLDGYDDGFIVIALNNVANGKACGDVTINYKWHLSGPTSTAAAIGFNGGLGPDVAADHWVTSVAAGVTAIPFTAVGAAIAPITSSLVPVAKTGSSGITSLLAAGTGSINFLKTGLFNVFSKLRMRSVDPVHPLNPLLKTPLNQTVDTFSASVTGGATILSDWDDGFQDQDAFTYDVAAVTTDVNAPIMTPFVDGMSINDIVHVVSLPATYSPQMGLNGGAGSNQNAFYQGTHNTVTQIDGWLGDTIIEEVPDAFTRLKRYYARQKDKKDKELEEKFKKMDYLLSKIGDVKEESRVKPLKIDEKEWFDIKVPKGSPRSKSLPRK